jgi:hypothetical protein
MKGCTGVRNNTVVLKQYRDKGASVDVLRSGRLAKLVGTVPVNPFTLRTNQVSSVKSPSSFGMVPVISFQAIPR